ncbi:hypothetical protein ACET3Z_011537 [Daucus carota]
MTGYRLTTDNRIDNYGQDKMWKMQKQALRKRKSQIASAVEFWSLTDWDDINSLKGQLQAHPLLGWGEAPTFRPIAAEGQPLVLAKVTEVCNMLTTRTTGMPLISVLSKVGWILQGQNLAFVRAGVDMAIIDAVANMIGMPLWRVFGGASNTMNTDITIPFVSSEKAYQLGSDYLTKGFKTLKLKVGKNLNSDIEMIRAVRKAHPDCSLILDANEGYSSSEAIQILQTLHEMKLSPVMFEQPIHRSDWEGLDRVNKIAKEKYGVSVAADESCRGLDAKMIIERNLADVINIKLAKLGVLGTYDWWDG